LPLLIRFGLPEKPMEKYDYQLAVISKIFFLLFFIKFKDITKLEQKIEEKFYQNK